MAAASWKPPPMWEKLLLCIRDFRRTLIAPVDTIGCNKLHDEHASHEVQRYQKLIALMLSSQTRDEMTSLAMENLKRAGCTPLQVIEMSDSDIISHIRSVSFHNTKARHIKQATELIITKYDGLVPRKYDDVIGLPGIGPKMAHLFMQEADGLVLGIGVDTHVHRIAQRFHWVPLPVKTPEDTRIALESWIPKKYWRELNILLVGLGQTVCKAKTPLCGECAASALCPSAFTSAKAVQTSGASRRRLSRGDPGGLVDLEEVIPKCARRSQSANNKVAASKLRRGAGIPSKKQIR